MADFDQEEVQPGSSRSIKYNEDNDRNGDEVDVENEPLLISQGSQSTSRSRKATTSSVGNWKQVDSKSLFSCSTTTTIGLLLLLAMVVTTVLSVFLQRYSSNKYIDIIGPSNATVNNVTSDVVLSL